ncbi:MAG: molybdenum cofactor biosynthesis protein, partial [bacterium]|nr:molybdenum cofactor biosynthesis protein [bacterium]
MAKIDGSRAFVPVNVAVLTVSDSRGPEDDTSGDKLQQMITADGHQVVARDIVKDDIDTIRERFRALIGDPQVDVVISTGGTGVTGRDVTPEALKGVIEKEIEG